MQEPRDLTGEKLESLGFSYDKYSELYEHSLSQYSLELEDENCFMLMKYSFPIVKVTSIDRFIKIIYYLERLKLDYLWKRKEI